MYFLFSSFCTWLVSVKVLHMLWKTVPDLSFSLGFPCSPVGKQSACYKPVIHVNVWQKPPQYCKVINWKKKRTCLKYRRPGFDSLGQEDPWRRKWQPTPVFLPGKPHGQRSLAGYSPWGCKSQTDDLVTKPPPPLIRLVCFPPHSQLLTDGWFWCLTILPSFHSLEDLYGEEGCSLAMWWLFFSRMILGLYSK